MRSALSSPLGVHRVLDPAGVLPQAADSLDASPAIWPDEVRLAVERLNVDSSSYRQLVAAHHGDYDAIRRDLVTLIRRRGKLHNPATNSGGILLGVVDEVGPRSPLGLSLGERVATLVSLSLTPLHLTDELAGWDGRSEQIPARGHAILFARSAVARLPEDIDASIAMALCDVCGAAGLTDRTVRRATIQRGRSLVITVLGAGGKSGALALVAARRAGSSHIIGIVPTADEARALTSTNLADEVLVLDARDAVAVASRVVTRADVTVVCVNTDGCEAGAILATAEGGTVLFFSMATSFARAALTAEGLVADVTLLIGNGYVPGAADMAFDLWREEPALRSALDSRLRH